MRDLIRFDAVVERRLATVRASLDAVGTSRANQAQWPSLRAELDSGTIRLVHALGGRLRRSPRWGGSVYLTLAGLRGGRALTVDGALRGWRQSARFMLAKAGAK